MARIAGVDIPNNKRVEIALTRIYGIGPVLAKQIAGKANIDLSRRVSELSDSELGLLKKIIENDYSDRIEGSLRRSQKSDMDRLRRIRSFRGLMHIKGLPVRGQRTKTNARTRKGPKGTAVKKKAKPGKK